MHGIEHDISREHSPLLSNEKRNKKKEEEYVCGHALKMNIARWINMALSWIVRLYSFPWFLNIFITRKMDDPIDIDRFCIALGIIINTIIIFVCVHIYGVLDKIYPFEIAYWSTILILACCLNLDNYIDRKRKMDDAKAWKDAFLATHDTPKEQENQIREIADKYADAREEARRLDKEYDHAIWWFLGGYDNDQHKDILKDLKGKVLREKSEVYGKCGDFFVIHFILISIFVGITAGYIAVLAFDVVNGKQLISTYSDFYTISALLIANIVGGYNIISGVSLWFLNYVHVKVSKDENQANDDKSNDDSKHDEDD